MPSTVLVNEIVDKLIEKLMADAELAAEPCGGRIFPGIEDTDTYPVLVVSGVSGENTRTLSGTQVWRDAVIQVAARDKGGTDYAKLILIARRVGIVLEGLRIQDGDGIYIGKLSEARERPQGPQNINGVLYPQIVLEFDTKAYRLS
jgi:hypothetical protein